MSFDRVMTRIDALHGEDVRPSRDDPAVPFELQYARSCTRFLHRLRLAERSATESTESTQSKTDHSIQETEEKEEKKEKEEKEETEIAVRAQHLRRWRIPRQDYPMTRPGYLAWRTRLKTLAAEEVRDIMSAEGYSDDAMDRVGRMIRKQGIKTDANVQRLEDVACCVFLQDHFDAFRTSNEEEKVISVVRKTWPKMSETGHRVALTIDMTPECLAVIQRALS